MYLRPATTDDTPAIERFLVQHTDTSMFLRANLRMFGPCGGPAREATRMWLREEGGAITGVLGHTTFGVVLVQMPGDMPQAAILSTLGQSEIKGIFGATEQVHQLRRLLGLDSADAQLDDDEPLYSLDLDHIDTPDGASTLRGATPADSSLMVDWRQAYLMETFHFSEDEAAEIAQADVDRMLERQSLMLLECADGTPLAMTSFNAILPDMVQIGNVFTPLNVRGQGYARRAVALHLEVARHDGVKRAILFASGPAASRAYEAIGFRQIGCFTLLFFAGVEVARVAA